MKQLIDVLFAAVYLAVLALGAFGFLNTLAVAVAFFVLLTVTLIYKFFPVNEESMGREFVELDKYKSELARRRLAIDKVCIIIDSMILSISKVRTVLNNFFYVLE